MCSCSTILGLSLSQPIHGSASCNNTNGAFRNIFPCLERTHRCNSKRSSPTTHTALISLLRLPAPPRFSRMLSTSKFTLLVEFTENEENNYNEGKKYTNNLSASDVVASWLSMESTPPRPVSAGHQARSSETRSQFSVPSPRLTCSVRLPQIFYP